MLLSSAVERQGYFSFSASSTVLPAWGPAEHEELRRDRTRTASLHWPKGYSILYDIIRKRTSKMVGTWLGEQLLLVDWLDISPQVVSNCLCITCFLYIYLCTYLQSYIFKNIHAWFYTCIIITIISLFLFCFIRHLSSQHTSSTFFFQFSPPSHWEEGE